MVSQDKFLSDIKLHHNNRALRFVLGVLSVPCADYGMITILKTDEEGGLQMNLDGVWVDINPIPGTFIVNIGMPHHLFRIQQGFAQVTATVPTLCAMQRETLHGKEFAFPIQIASVANLCHQP